MIEITENQKKCILPLNDVSATIFYNQRLIISAPINEPLSWRVSKLEDTSPKGVRRITFAQDKFDQYNDYIEYDSDGYVIGMWANYYNSNIVPTNQPNYLPIQPSENDDQSEEPIITSTLSCSGKPQIKIGGSSKTITARFYSDSEEIEAPENGFIFTIDGDDAATLLSVEALSESAVKIKFLGNDTYIGKILSIKNVSDEIVSTLDIEIVPL